ncbi:MAG: hypothetical protein ACOYKM_01055 [Caulobacterales bacterium]
MLKTRLVAREALSAADVDAMWSVFVAHYDAVHRDGFDRDLAEKEAVFLMEDEEGLCRGFSTYKVTDGLGPSGPARFIYSGDTIIVPEYWGRNDFALCWLRQAGRIAARARSPLYWFLIVKGHRTYRYLSAFALEYWPRPSVTPKAVKLAMDSVATAHFGGEYDAEAGVVRFARPHGHLREDLALPNSTEAARPDVQFFLTANPGYRRGEELVCLCELVPGNLRPLARRAFAAGLAGANADGC